jgi:ketosteroid isomerase-like protein
LGVQGATKDDTLAMLTRMKARVLTNTADTIIAEYGPEGFLSSDGKPLKEPMRVQLRFRDGKLVQSIY